MASAVYFVVIVKSCFKNEHMNNKGWSDIGYNFVIGEDGNVYEGRGWGKKGAHSIPFNSKSIGICIIGNYSSKRDIEDNT